jgi:copper chaperone NosL
MKKKELRNWVRAGVFISALLLMLVLFFPMWQIQLTAPQYPEGLGLKIYPGKIGGDVEIVNGLNHYIGMKTLHTKDFIEFTILPYCIGFFALLILITGFRNRKSMLYFTTILFIIFCIVAMADFWKWEYNYGHNLNPEAPIQVPGMTYQPPLLGYKQLLNFSAFSIPDTGGWIFIAAAALLVLCMITEIISSKKQKKKSFATAVVMIFLLPVFFTSCASGPEPIQVGKEACNYCKMTVSDARFGGEIVTTKGKVYKFDDMHCMMSFMQEGKIAKPDIKEMYAVDFSGNHNLIKADENLFLFKCDALQSPMGGNIAAFNNRDSLAVLMKKYKKGIPLNWDELIK